MKSSPLFFVATVLLLLVSAFVHASAEAEPAKESNVVQLTGDNFDELTRLYEADRGDWLIKFYAPWCGHCKKLAPIFEDLAAELKDSTTHIAEIDVEAHTEIKDRFGVSGYPTLLFFKGGKMYTFKGQRTVEGFSEFIKTGHEALDAKPVPKKRDPNAPSHVVVLEQSTFEDVTAVSTGAKGPWLIKFYAPWCGHCKQMAPAYDALSQDLLGLVNIGKVDVTVHEELGDRFGVQGFPTLFFFADGKMYSYEGKRTVDAMTEFVTGGFKDVAGDTVPSIDGTVPDAESAVVTVTEANFDQLLAEGGSWFIEFYAPWCPHCKKLARTWERLGAHFAGRSDVRIGKVDATTAAELKLKYEVESFPTMLYFHNGQLFEYSGPRSLGPMQSFVDQDYLKYEPKVLGASPISDLTDDTFDAATRIGQAGADAWLIQFHAPWCGHCQDMAPAMRQAAVALADSDVRVARVDAEANKKLAMRFGVDAFPVLVLVRDGKLYEFEGLRDPKLMTAFALSEFAAVESRPAPTARGVSLAQKDLPAGVTKLSVASVRALIASGAKHIVMIHAPWCGWCNKFMPTFGKAAEALAGQVSFGSLDGSAAANAPVMHAFNVTSYPTILLLSDQTFVTYKGDKTLDDLKTFATTAHPAAAPLPTIPEKAPKVEKAKAEKAKTETKAEAKTDTVELAKAVHVAEWTADDFDAFVDGPAANAELALVELYAQWCGPCRAFSPVYEQAAEALKQQNVVVARIDGALEPEMRDRLGVKSYPTLLVVDKARRVYHTFTASERSLKVVLDFASGSYKKEPAMPLPAAPSQLQGTIVMVLSILLLGGGVGWSTGRFGNTKVKKHLKPKAKTLKQK